MSTPIRLTELTAAGGCGCKLSPTLLRELLTGNAEKAAAAFPVPPQLMVGWDSSDDAACWRLSDDAAILATADFFSPIVDDAFDFGKIAAANALSDIYAMGGKPLFALALCAMPKDKLPAATIRAILDGGKSLCAGAGVAVAGGHSIDSAEPLYGLCVIGAARPDRVLQNGGGRPGDALLLTKPLGVGVYSAALRRGKLTAAQYDEMLSSITSLNRGGGDIADAGDIARAMTDVTGFGLLGHLREMCGGEEGGIGAEIVFGDIPLFAAAADYARAGVVTGASRRNFAAVADRVCVDEALEKWQVDILTDAQTGGGLLIACAPDRVAAAQAVFAKRDQTATVIGALTANHKIVVRP